MGNFLRSKAPFSNSSELDRMVQTALSIGQKEQHGTVSQLFFMTSMQRFFFFSQRVVQMIWVGRD
jgi:hypothetical protein